MYAVCKLKCANHRMPIVSDIYSNVPVDERICNICQLNEIGDEFHYLFKCKYFNKHRCKFVKHYYYIHVNMHKMTQLFDDTNDTELIKLAKFISIIIIHLKNG
ncbi:unnamed protein product [Meganyctiphanes norvegica]|uniref:Uncharacterized protein n=1 Tax=Meganyctiphanes norvegica TaxID=48144 RepID=A0AAV2QDD5_MEGNR